MEITTQTLEIRLPTYQAMVQCRFEAEFAEDEKIAVHLKLPTSLVFAEQDAKVELILPHGSIIPCLFDGLHIEGSLPICDVKLRPLISLLALNMSDDLCRLNALVYNFGDRQLYRNRGRRLLLEDGLWRFELIPAGEQTMSLLKQLQSHTFRAIHYLTLVRSDGTKFSSSDANKCLVEVQRFLSFCHGQQVGVGFATGMDDQGEKVLDIVGMGRVDRYADGENWLDRHGSKHLPNLYLKFLNKIRDEEWEACFRIAVYWTFRANTNNTGPDGGLILLQTALERLTWDVLTSTSYGKLSATKTGSMGVTVRLRSVLEMFQIPTAIPPAFNEISDLVNSEHWLDGPEAFIKVRNEIVHPSKRLKSKRLPYYQAYVLGKWYLELILLALLDYEGDYSNRTRLHRWVGETELVPWVENK